MENMFSAASDAAVPGRRVAPLWLLRLQILGVEMLRKLPRIVWYGEEVEVRVNFREAKLDQTAPFSSLQEGHLAKVEAALAEIGITFDKGVGPDGRDWEWDWSLKGPISISYIGRASKPERRK